MLDKKLKIEYNIFIVFGTSLTSTVLTSNVVSLYCLILKMFSLFAGLCICCLIVRLSVCLSVSLYVKKLAHMCLLRNWNSFPLKWQSISLWFSQIKAQAYPSGPILELTIIGKKGESIIVTSINQSCILINNFCFVGDKNKSW